MTAFTATKEFTKLAFRLAIDVHRTLVPLSYPSHTIALACLYLASFLDPSHPNSQPPLSSEGEPEIWPEHAIAFHPGWSDPYASSMSDIEGLQFPFFSQSRTPY